MPVTMSRGANKLINQVKKCIRKVDSRSLASSFFKEKKMTLILGMYYIHITMRKRVSTKLHSKLLLYGTILLLFMHNVDKLSQKCENLISTPRKMHTVHSAALNTPRILRRHAHCLDSLCL